MSLIRKIKDYYNKKDNEKCLLFTTPSHAQGNFVAPSAKKLLGEKFFKCDFSEIEGFDNLRAPEGILEKLIKELTRIYKSKKTFLLTNGSTSGIIAIINAILKENDKVLVARNCHISVYNGLVISGACPVWFMPEYDKDWGIFKGINAQEIENQLKKNTDIKALILTSPTYEGLFSDIEGISKVCKKFNVKLIVDEAHGALLNFGDFKVKPSIQIGADASVQSLHKTAGAPNPCALLHLASDSQIESEKVQESLNLINTTSPSYPLMLAIEAVAGYLDSVSGKKHVKTLQKNIELLKAATNANIAFYEEFNDPTKLLVKIQNLSGIEASNILNNKFKIEEEFSNAQSMLFITGIGTDGAKLKKLKDALNLLKPDKSLENPSIIDCELPEQKLTPRQAYYKEQETLELESAAGRISAEVVVNYPPGIPVLIPGEVITKEAIAVLKSEKSVIKVIK